MNRYDINQQRQCMGCMEFYSAAYDICPNCGYEDGQKAMELLHIDPGTLLANRYIIGRALGYGGFGVTYLAWDTQLKRKLAIKEYLPSEFATRMIHHQDLIVANNEKKHQQYKDGMKKFLQEGQKLAQVSNIDGIVHMYDCFEANNTAYITMEYLEGETLAAFLEREGQISEQQAMDFILPVMQALETVHEKGIIHRDIAPDNIFLSRNASGELKVKLIDFGAAKFATTSHSKSLTVIIKPGYSPEEQYRSNGDQGSYTDVYALAAVLYRMVTGVQPPDAFERRTMIESKKRDLLEEPSKYNRELSANFENALLNAMNVRIEDRTATITEFEEELISFEPVKRRGSSIRRIDFMRWPLWAKIGVPVGSVAALALLIWGLIAVFTNPETSYELPEGMTRVPDFVTADFAQAQEWAGEAVLLIGSTGTEYVPNAAENVVLRQDVYSGAVVLENTMVSVVVSTGEESYYLPDVTGMEIEAARAALECMGLEIIVAPCEQVAGLAANCVVSQDLEPYTMVKTGDTITISVTDNGSGAAGTACKLVGLAYSEALNAAAGAGAVIRVTERVFSDSCTAPQIQSQSVAEGTAIAAGTVIDVTVAVPMRQFTMPNLLYKSQETAKQLLKNIGIEASVESTISEIIAKGLVAEQSVEKEQPVAPGDAVMLIVSSGSKPFAMPDVAGNTEEDARKILTESTLVVSVEYDYDPAVKEGCVIRQSVKAGADVTRGTEVSIVICSTKDLIQVMNVQGMGAEEARTALEAAGLKVMIEETYGTDENAGKVIDQLPAASSYQKPGTTVVLTVSKGAKRAEVPNVLGMSRSEAASVLKNAGFDIKITEVYDTNSTKGKVIGQSPEGGSSQKEGTTISLRVSIGSRPVETQLPEETEPPTEAAWSDWVTSLPSGVSSDSHEIETKTQYRSRMRETATSSNSSMDGWTLYDTKSEWGDWGAWSDWSNSAVSANDSTKVETKTQYRYADKIYTTSESSSLSGWTQYDSSTSWTDWGSWSSWQDGSVSASDSRQVESRTVYGYYYFQCPACGAHMHLWSYTCFTWAGGCGQAVIPEGSWHEVWSTTSWDNAGLKDWYGTGKYYTYINGQLVFKWDNGGGDPKTQYRFRDRSQITTYYYWKWDDWSSWSDSAYSGSNNRKVENRTMYRYCTRSVVYTYYYERYGAWSSWSDSAITESGSVDVETRKLYRYRKK